MILFMIIKKESGPAEPGGPPRYEIPANYSGEKINEGNVRLISWNEVDYTLSEGGKLQIRNVEGLKAALFDAMRMDPLCNDINRQCFNQFGINLFEAWQNPEHANQEIIRDVFASWPHPMIGNVLVSSGMRPQTTEKQYADNWESFPSKYMTQETKEAINAIFKDLRGAGLEKLTKSGRDQVRV